MIPYKVVDKISLGPINIYTWGLLVGLAFLAGWLLLLHQARRHKLKRDEMTTLGLWILGGAILGARILYVLENYSFFTSDLWSVFRIWEGGLSYYGGLIGGLTATLVYVRKKKLDLKRILDVLALSLALGIVIGRLGCFLINDHLGEITQMPWGIRYPDGSLRHPVALYLSFSGLLCFIFLSIIKKHVRTKGMLTTIFLLWYSVSRFLLDFTRSRNENLPFADNHYFGFTLAQFLSIALFLFALYFIIKIKRQKNAQRFQKRSQQSRKTAS